MILITGGAGFIGSNLQAALVRRGLETVVVDNLGSAGKWRNLAKHPPARLLPPSEIDAFLDSRPPLEMVYHLGAISDTTAADGDVAWATNVELSRYIWHWCANHGVRLVYASSAATYGDGSAGFDDDVTPAALAEAAPAQPVWLDQARLRPSRRPRHRDAAAASAAMGRAEVLQRLWPERVPQGRHDLGGQGQARRGGRRRCGAAVPLHRARPRRRRAAARLHLGRRRGRRAAVAARHAGGERAVQRRHRPGAHLSGPGPRGVRRRRRAAQDRVHRHAGARCAASISRSPRHRSPGCAPPATRASSRRSRKVSGATCRIIWRSPTPTHDPGPAVPAVRPGHRADRAIRHPLVRAGVYRRPGARLAAAAASGAAGAGGGDAGTGRRFPHLGDARRRAGRAARLRAVLSAGRLSGASRA